jgi:hypothetical protein
MTNEQIRPRNETSFKKDLTTPISQERLGQMRMEYLDGITRRQIELQRASEGEITQLQATGEYPITTPYDALPGNPSLLPPEMVAEALVIRQVDLETFTHPQRIKALKKMEQAGYSPIGGKTIPVLDVALEEGETLSFADLGFGIETVEKAAQQRGVDPDDIEDSANELLASGTFSWSNKRLPTLPYLLSSTPDVIGAHSLATMALAQGVGFVPIDSIWGDKDNQILMWMRAQELCQNDPSLKDHPDREYLLNRAQNLVGVTLKSNPKDAAERARFLYDHGVRTFRVYDPRSFPRMVDTVDAVRQTVGGDAIIFAGQTVGVDQAHALQGAGADAVIVGIGEGGICKTPGEASLAVNNLLTGYEITRSGLLIPLIYDAGVGPKTAIAMGIGAGGVMKSQAIGKGIEKPAFMYWWKSGNGEWESLYSGEAAPRTKYLGKKFDSLGRIIFAEGADEKVVYDPNIPSTATALYYLHQSLATALVFQRGSITDLQHDPHPDIHRPSQNAIKSASVHHISR